MKNFYFICVNYNNYKFTEKYVESIKAIENNNSIKKIIVVDNNSNIEDKKMLKQLQLNNQKVEIIFSETNIGYFGGLNLGLKTLSQDKNKVVIIGNNDIEFEKTFIDDYKQVKHDDKNIMVICPDVVTLDEHHQNPLRINRTKKIDLIKSDIKNASYIMYRIIHFLLKPFSKNKKANEKIEQEMIIESGIGACYILTNNFFKSFDYLYDEVFLWGEEAVLSYQLRSVGGKQLYVPNIVVRHAESASVKKILNKDKYKMIKKSYKTYRKYL